MKITDDNQEIVKAFMKILMDIEISDDCIEAIVIMLKNLDQMDEVVDYIEQNPTVTEEQVLAMVEEMYRQ